MIFDKTFAFISFHSIMLLMTVSENSSGADSVTIQITNMCTTNLVLDCDGYSAVELTPTQIFGFNYAPTATTVTKCRARCKQRTSRTEFDVYNGRAPADNNNWETADDGIYYIKRVKYYNVGTVSK